MHRPEATSTARSSMGDRRLSGWKSALAALRFDYRGADLGAEVERLAHRRAAPSARRSRPRAGISTGNASMDAVQQRIAADIERQRFIVRSRPCGTSSNSRPAWLLSTPRCSSRGRAARVRSSWSGCCTSTAPARPRAAGYPSTARRSPRRSRIRAVRLTCAAPFTGRRPRQARPLRGRADGTLFLDEVGESHPRSRPSSFARLQRARSAVSGASAPSRSGLASSPRRTGTCEPASPTGPFARISTFASPRSSSVCRPLRDRRRTFLPWSTSSCAVRVTA